MAAVLISTRVRGASEDPTPAPSLTPTPPPMLLLDNFGSVVAVPPSSLPPGLLPKANVGIENQIPNPVAKGAKMPAEVIDRIDAAQPPPGFHLFPSAQAPLASFLAGNDELGNTAIRPGPLIPIFPLEPVVQGWRYDVSRIGLHYSMRQTFNYSGSTETQSGAEDLGFYTADWIAKWTVYSTPSSAGWLSAQIEGKSGLGPSGQTQDAQKNLGTLTSPTQLWSSHNGVRIPELAWQQSLLRGRFVFLAGVVSQGNYLDSNLYANTARGQFLNSALVNSMVVPLPGHNFGINLQWQPSDTAYAMLGATAGKASAGQTPWTNFSWADWSIVGELGYTPADFLGLGAGVYRIDPFVARAGGPTQVGISFNFRQRLGEHSPFGLFGRFGVGGSQVSAGASAQIGTGVVMNGPLAEIGLVPKLTNDLVGVGFVWSQPSATTQTVYHRNEYVLETFYTLQLSPTTRIEPDVQIVWSPVFSPKSGPSAVFQIQYILGW